MSFGAKMSSLNVMTSCFLPIPLSFLSMATQERGQTWSDDEVKALIAIWADPQIQHELNSSTKNMHIFNKIAKTLGETRNGLQCQRKIKSLKVEWRQTKDKLNKSGASGKIKFKHFHALNEVLGCRPESAPPKVVESLYAGEEEEEDTNTGATSSDDETLTNDGVYFSLSI